MLLTPDSFKQWKPKLREVPLEDFNGSLYVRELRAAEALSFAKAHATDPTSGAYSLILTATTDADGKQFFPAGDINAAENLPYGVSNVLFTAICEHNGLFDDAKKKKSEEQQSGTTPISA